MPRAALIAGLCLALTWLWPAVAAIAAGPNPHLDLSLLPSGCMACHRGHGASRSPMLPAPQKQVCLACHGSRSRQVQMVQQGHLASDAHTVLLDEVLAQPYVHPISDTAFWALEPGEVSCTSCHSPHRGRSPDTLLQVGLSGVQRLSPRNPLQLEHELCESCHGSGGATTQSLTDISRLLSPENASYHPVVAPTMERSPSVRAELSGRYINCTDCHGGSSRGAPAGPHGSEVPYILVAGYTTTDGATESWSAYALCYRCHEREQVLAQTLFPEHGMHIVEIGASCATCHNAHGSLSNRALIRFGEETFVSGVSPSMASGRLEHASTGPGSGTCYLSCHGVDHDPRTYGMAEELQHLRQRSLLGKRSTSWQPTP